MRWSPASSGTWGRSEPSLPETLEGGVERGQHQSKPVQAAGGLLPNDGGESRGGCKVGQGGVTEFGRAVKAEAEAPIRLCGRAGQPRR